MAHDYPYASCLSADDRNNGNHNDNDANVYSVERVTDLAIFVMFQIVQNLLA